MRAAAVARRLTAARVSRVASDAWTRGLLRRTRRRPRPRVLVLVLVDRPGRSGVPCASVTPSPRRPPRVHRASPRRVRRARRHFRRPRPLRLLARRQTAALERGSPRTDPPIPRPAPARARPTRWRPTPTRPWTCSSADASSSLPGASRVPMQRRLAHPRRARRRSRGLVAISSRRRSRRRRRRRRPRARPPRRHRPPTATSADATTAAPERFSSNNNRRSRVDANETRRSTQVAHRVSVCLGDVADVFPPETSTITCEETNA